MISILKILYGIIFLQMLVFVSCKKQVIFEATIYTVDNHSFPISNVPVRFYLQGSGSTTAIDTLVNTNSKGAANLSLPNNCYLYVEVIYRNAENGYQSARTTINFEKNSHNIDTLKLNL